MNKIEKLFDLTYVNQLFTKEVLPLYPGFSSLQVEEIYYHKKYIWESTYHVVVEFKVLLDRTKEIRIFSSAHSNEPRYNVYFALKYLWDKGFSLDMSIPKPLFYHQDLGAIFYQGLEGKNLFHYIKNRNFDKILQVIPEISAWFVRLHSLPVTDAENFNPHSAHLETVVPGKDCVLKNIKRVCPKHYSFYKKAYDFFISREASLFPANEKRCLIHGDAHPENIVVFPEGIGVIDFTDICVADFTRDLGCFLQQTEYMMRRKMLPGENLENFINQVQALFISTYFKLRNLELDENLQTRIDNYYYWTAIRTATYLLTRDEPKADRAEELIELIKNKLKI
jgi:aminoglycoside phosphotransferase (APT) family kinase protein